MTIQNRHDKKNKTKCRKMTKHMTKINMQQPSEFAGKIFIMIVFGNVFGNVLSSMGQSLSTTKKNISTFFGGSA